MAPTRMALLALVSFLAIACGGGKTPPPATAKSAANGATPAAVHEHVIPHTCAARTKLAQLLGHTDAPPAPAGNQSAESAAPPGTSVDAGGAAKIPANQIYRLVAPATVLIRTDRGMGTGVVIDPKGYVLTNYHVIADGREKDFVVSVQVTFGDLTPTGRMSRQEKTYEAEVVKGDMVRDMAIVKIKDPPANLTAIKLAKSAPQIAEKVISLGHAGIGFLWAAKTCSIASIGERQHDTSKLAAYDCANPDPALSKAEAEAFKTRCDESKKQMSEALMASTQGIAIQTDCAITHGDSGGPLVNAAGELVGLNQSISVDMATASFHVHLDEIRNFVSKYPDQAIAIVPDPFCDGGSNPSLEDLDLDGSPDTLVTTGGATLLGGYDRMSLLIDLDEDQFKKKIDTARKEGIDAFETEIALLRTGDATYVWYDTDNDAHFDVLLVDRDDDGKPDKAYRLDAQGQPKPDESGLPQHDLSGKLVKDPALRVRLGKIATAIGGSKYMSEKTLAAASKAMTLPDPILGGGTQGRVLDSDGDGKPDLAVMRGPFSRSMLIDADEDSLNKLKSGDAADEIVKSKKIDAEVSIVIQASSVWVTYDTDNDGKFDLTLMTNHGTDPTSLVASQAWHLGSGGEMSPAPEHIGRKIMRPGLVSGLPRVARAMRALSSDVAEDEAMGSLPDPHVSPRARFRARDLKGFPPSTVVEAETMTSSAILVDVDHDTKLGKSPKDADVQKLVSDGKFDAEVAVVHHSGPDGGSDWIYYDTDNDGTFDLVLFAAASGKEPTQAYRLKNKADTKLEVDAASVAGKAFRYKVFRNKAIGTSWKAIAAKTFSASSIEE